MKSIAYICPQLPEANVNKILSEMRHAIHSTWEYTETASLIEAFTLIIKNTKVDFLEICRILIDLKHFLVHLKEAVVQLLRLLVK